MQEALQAMALVLVTLPVEQLICWNNFLNEFGSFHGRSLLSLEVEVNKQSHIAQIGS